MSSLDNIPQDEISDTFILKKIWPYLLMMALSSVLMCFAILKYVPSSITGAGGSVNYVVFDVIKFINAQKSVAATFLNNKDSNSDSASQANYVFYKFSEKTREAFKKIAGANAVILVKQTTIQSPGVRDITDDVLKELNLPTNVPTVDGGNYAIDIAPTYLTSNFYNPNSSKAPVSTPASSPEVIP